MKSARSESMPRMLWLYRSLRRPPFNLPVYNHIDCSTDQRLSFCTGRVAYWLAHTIRAIQRTFFAESVRSAWAGLSEVNSIVLAVRRFYSFTTNSPLRVFTTTRSPRRMGLAGETRMMVPSR